MYRKLTIEPFAPPLQPFDPGPAPMVQWIEIEKLIVDDSYQREIGRRGAANIRLIAESFDWSKFAPVIVAPVESGMFAIVDGQHRTTAAMLRGLKSVPCQVVQADRAKQAAAYAAVNGNVTKTTPQQLYHAKLAAGEPNARELEEVCQAADVRIIRRNLVLARMQTGETQAVGALARCLRDFGRDTLITALQCITRTADGNAGFVRATIVEGLCETLSRNQHWRDAGEALLRAMDNFSLPDMWERVSGGRDQIFPATVRKLVAEQVAEHLERKLGPAICKRAA